MSKYVRHVSLFWFMLVVRISCYEFSVKSSFFSRFHRNSIRQLQLSNLKVASAKTSISPVDFHPRLAVSKWIVPRPFLMGGVFEVNFFFAAKYGKRVIIPSSIAHTKRRIASLPHTAFRCCDSRPSAATSVSKLRRR